MAPSRAFAPPPRVYLRQSDQIRLALSSRARVASVWFAAASGPAGCLVTLTRIEGLRRRASPSVAERRPAIVTAGRLLAPPHAHTSLSWRSHLTAARGRPTADAPPPPAPPGRQLVPEWRRGTAA